ncbi:VWA domain-containing protein [Aestuariispira ectoiniformans]|uniref:VWA domain-containing protein n=1 Tax=Aestuariispira ectoiniformans TaxID=2775080 RepID=UPI00223AF17F|nr:VWA domain-containing protein [Aestuariispira ectoiniformans]
MSKLPSDRPETKPVSSDDEIDAFLDKVQSMKPAASAGMGRRGRLIFAMDATASRQPLWDHACHIQADMFQETQTIGGLEVQLVYYRGYKECKASKWQMDGKGLSRLMTSVSCLGGHTQIDRVLAHCLNQTRKEKVDAVIFVGDAFEEEIDDVCAKAGELGMMGVPVFLFQEGLNPVAERAFRQIAKLTGGAWCSFDMNSAKQLRDLLAAVAVYAAGGRQAMLDYSDRVGGEVLKLTSRFRGQQNK